MTRPLRQRHRRIFAALAVILPVLFAIGVAARKAVPTVESLPAAITPGAVAFASKIWSRDDLFAKTPVHGVLLREHENTGPFAIQLSAPATFAKPDLLVYWTTGSVEEKNKIPDDAALLGVFSGAIPLQFPNGHSPMQGALILYSLADGEVVDVSKSISLQ